MSRLLLQLFDVTHLFGMHLRPELVLLQKTMVQVEGVSRGLDPQHDMWTASRPIVERWVKRELGPEAIAKRGIDEAALGFQALRRLPQTLAAIEAAARKVSTEAPREDRHWYQMPVFWIGILAGGVLGLVLTSQQAPPPPAQPAVVQQQQQAPAPRPAPVAPQPSATPTTNPVTGAALSDTPPDIETTTATTTTTGRAP
jgi:ubiquinone biosynthesis protein